MLTKRTIRHSLLLSAALLAMLSAAACGTQGSEPTSTSSADWNKGPNAVQPGLHRIVPPAFQITDCTLPEYVGILTAFNTSQTNAAELALGVSTDVDVRAFAQQVLTDEKNMASQLSTWMTQQTVTPVDSEISVDIGLASQALLAQLKGDQSFDRDFIVGEIGAHWMLSGFLDTVGFSQDFTSGTSTTPTQGGDQGGERQFVAIVQGAMQAVQAHLGLAFQAESKLVGMCGVAPAVVTPPPDAGSSSESDCGCSSGSCANAR